MFRPPALWTALALCFGFAPAAPALEATESPSYKNWAKFKKGTAVVLKGSTEVAGTKTETVITHTLAELTDDKAVVETTTVTKVNDMEIKGPPVRVEHAKTVELPAGKPAGEAAKPDGVFDQGEETVKAAGGEYKTKWFKSKISTGGVEAESQSWTSDDVPGMVVKMLTKTTGMFASTTTMELVEVKKP